MGFEIMLSTKQIPAGANRPEIVRLLRAARTHGAIDAYAGKRRATRAAEGMQLELTTNPDDPTAATAVAMHDISEGGVSFWTRQELDLRAVIYLREFSNGESRSWIPARVKHRTMGLRGYLIGASFDTNGMSGAASAPVKARRGPIAPLQMLPPGWRGPRP